MQSNLLQGTRKDTLAFGGTLTLTVRKPESGINVDVELPNCAMRDLGIAIDDELQVYLCRAASEQSRWSLTIPAGIKQINQGEEGEVFMLGNYR